MIISEKDCKDYFRIWGLNPISIDKINMQLVKCFISRKQDVILSNNKNIWRICKLLGIRNRKKTDALVEVENYWTMLDALKILSKMEVPVFFYNRVGIKEGFKYSKKATQRIKGGIDFPKMVSNISRYDSFFKEILGSSYSTEYIEQLAAIPQVIHKNNIYCHEDSKTKHVNVFEGKRINIPTNASATRTIHVYGRCGVFGYAVSDEQTFPSYLQKILLENEYNDFNVVNHGLWGGDDKYILNNFFYNISNLKKGDIVLFYMMHFEEKIMEKFKELHMYYKDITDEWHQYDEAQYCFYDKPGHMNAIGYRHLAEIIYEDLKGINFDTYRVEPTSLQIKTGYLSAYLKEYANSNFSLEIDNYLKELYIQYPEIRKTSGKIGAIVMNCNPFTKGHRFLIEYASSKVDKLIVFVVEEDRSFIKYQDRFEMVKLGSADLANVIVVPSGRFIISAITFPEYFLKDYVQQKEFDLSQDVDTFCKLIAPPLGITVRFVGEEPIDSVTRSYNDNMRIILPKYGLEFVEIPRLKIPDSSEIINATKVRQLINEKKIDELERYIPETTLSIILQKYMK